MKDCCRNQTTAFCSVCGADLEAKSLAGLKTYLRSKLQSARARLNKWMDSDDLGEEKVKQGIVRNTDTIIQLDSWIQELAKAMDPGVVPPKSE